MATAVEKSKDCKSKIDALEKEKATVKEEISGLQKKLASYDTAVVFRKGAGIDQGYSREQRRTEHNVQNQLKRLSQLDESIEDARQAYMTAIKEKFTLKIRPVRFNYLGIPRRGITSFRLRLMGMFTNIISAMAKGLYKRGDTSAQDGGQVIIRGNVTSDLGIIQATEEKVWSVLEDNLLYQIILKAVHEAHLNLPDPPQHGAAKPKRKGRSFVDRLRKKLHLGAHTTTPSDGDLEEIFSVVMDSMNAENWETIKILLDDLILLINTDTGGQAELLDLQAGLVQGPSFNLLFCRLIDELETKFKMYYTNEEKVSAMKEDAIMTLEELLFQVLATIACYSGCFANEDDIPTASDESSVKKLSLAAKSKVMFVGTHRDLVSEEEFKRKDRALQALIKNTEFYKRGIVKFTLEDQLMLTVNNMSGGEGEIREIRKVLERVIEQSFEQVDIPVTWLMLSLYIRKKNVRTMSLSDCEAAAAKFGINPQELQEVLWFLHHCIGVLLYYPEVEALKDTVICQMQVVYDSTSNLTKNVFTFERVGKMACERFREKAQFMLADVKKAMSGHSDDLIPPEKLVKLLEHRNILTVLPSTLTPGSQGKHSHEPTLFMPSVLQCARASDLSVLTTNSDSDPAPLMLRYECGYTPVGVFPAMITNLVSQQLNDWEMIEEGLRKNKVQFHVGKDCDIVTLISHPRYFEIVISRKEEFLVPTRALCAYVRHTIESTLASVTQHLHYHFKMAYKFGFECPSHPGRAHLCILSSETAEKMMCLQNPERKEPIWLEDEHKVWFLSACEEVCSCCGSTTLGLEDLSQLEDHTDVGSSQGQQSPHAGRSATPVHVSRSPHLCPPSSSHPSPSPHRHSPSRRLSPSRSRSPTPSLEPSGSHSLSLREVNPHLKKLDTTKLYELGGELGLNITELKKIAPIELHLELCERWLRENDDVHHTSGPPTWSSLVTALRSIGANGVATSIEQQELNLSSS